MPRGGSNYIPRPDADFAAWVAQYYDVIKPWWDDHKLAPEDLQPLQDALEVWNIAYPAHTAAQAAAEGARQAKDAARRELERRVRPLTNFIQSYPETTNADRASLGITVRPPKGTPAQTPTTRPLAIVEPGGRLTHHLRLVDESTPTRRARPRGVLGAEVWVRLVAPDEPTPTNPAALSFLTMTTRPSVRAEFRPGDGGKTAVYMLRWVNTRGEKGPWSDAATATIAA